MPSFCLSLYRNGKPTLATDYLARLARAALKAGSFHEYWTWVKYTGSTLAAGCEEYSETTSGFLDGVIHGYFGVRRLEAGWSSLRIAPQPGTSITQCSLTLPLPGGEITARFEKDQEGLWQAEVDSKAHRRLEVQLPDGRETTVIWDGTE